VGARQPRPDIAGAIDRAAGGGQPLPDAARSFMEPRFGHDFGAVRIHADRAAGELAGQLQARAFTTGHDVFFAPGEFQPGAAGGQRLLAHELAHVVQQSQGAPGVDRQIQRTGNGCANCQAYCGYDTPRDLTTYNCAGLAHRNYTYMQVPAILAAYAGNGTFASGGACSAPGIVQHWLWEFDIRMEDASGKVVVPTWQDFHTVAGPTPGDPVPYSSDEVYSKNGRRPVYGPGTGPGFRPAARSVATTNDPAETPLTDPASGAPLYKVRSNIVETRACLPCPRATP
jgi:hypothetical protein